MPSSETIWKVVAISVLAAGICVTIITMGQQRHSSPPCGSQPCSEGSPGGGAVAVLKDHFAEQGFFWASVLPEELKGGKWRYTVTPGDIYRFDRVVIVGADDAWSQEFAKTSPLRKGDIFRPSLLRPWLDPLEEPAGAGWQFPYRLNRFTVNTDREKHLVTLVLEVAKLEAVGVNEKHRGLAQR